MKKLVALVVVFAMLLSTACAGGGGGGTALDQAAQQPAATTGDAATTDDDGGADDDSGLPPYEIVYLMLANSVASTELPIVMEAVNAITVPAFNATVDINMITWGDWWQVVTTMMGAGEKIDILFTADWWQYTQSIAANHFLPLNDLMATYAPQMVMQLGPTFIEGSQFKGINFGVPTDKELAVNGGFLWNANLADYYGFNPDPSWTSVRDWIPYLEIIAENEPDIVPFLTDGAYFHIDFIGYLPLSTGWYGRTNDPTIYFAYELEPLVEEMRAVRELFLRGLVPVDSVVAGSDWINQHLSMGTFFLTTQPLKPGDSKSKELMSAAINQDIVYREFETFPLLVNTTHAGGSMLAISTTSQDPARAMMFINEMHTNPDLVNTLVWGVEGVTFEVYTEGPPKRVMPIEGNMWTGSILGWTLGNVFLTHLSRDEPYYKYDVLAATKYGIPAHIALGYRFDPADWLDTIAAVSNVIEEFSRVVRVGAVDTDEGLAELIAAVEAAGYREYQEAVRADFAAWLAEQ